MPTKEEADRVLKAHRYGKACYPCAKRKVKCNGVYPCSVCIQRGHPEICIVEAPKPRRRAVSSKAEDSPSRATKQARITPSSASDSADPAGGLKLEHRDSNAVVDGNAISPSSARDRPNTSSVGGHAISSLFNTVRRSVSDEDLGELRPGQGLQTSLHSDPYISRRPPGGVTELVNELIPTHAEILQYTECYQILFAPYYPLIPEPEDLEAIVIKFLERASAREGSQVPIFKGEVSRAEIGDAALLLAVMARGVQLSEVPPKYRVGLSREFARRSFQLSRLANFLLQPSLNTVQANLVLQHVLQNDGQADAAWCFLGQVVRLAQSIGVHQHPAPDMSAKDRKRRKGLWSMLVWQDCALSLCFDRSPINLRPHHAFASVRSGAQVLDYLEYMIELVAWGHDIMETSHELRSFVDEMLKNIRVLDQIHARGAQYLQSIEFCSNRQARIEHHLVRLQVNLCMGLACRPALKSTPAADRARDHGTIINRLKHSLIETIQAYLDLCSLTTLAMRQWTLTHAALGAAMILEYFGLADQNSRDVQTKFINFLVQNSDMDSEPDGVKNGEDSNSWLTTSHIRALRALQNSIARRQEKARSALPLTPAMSTHHHGLPTQHTSTIRPENNHFQQPQQQQQQHQQWRMPMMSPDVSSSNNETKFDPPVHQQQQQPPQPPPAQQLQSQYQPQTQQYLPHPPQTMLQVRGLQTPSPNTLDPSLTSFSYPQDLSTFDWDMAYPTFTDPTSAMNNHNHPSYGGTLDQTTFGF